MILGGVGVLRGKQYRGIQQRGIWGTQMEGVLYMSVRALLVVFALVASACGSVAAAGDASSAPASGDDAIEIVDAATVGAGVPMPTAQAGPPLTLPPGRVPRPTFRAPAPTVPTTSPTTAPTTTAPTTTAPPTSPTTAPPTTAPPTSPTTAPTTAPPPPDGSPEIVDGVVHRLTWEAPFDLGPVSHAEIRQHGPFDYATKGFGNGYQNRHLVEIVDGVGPMHGRWARFTNPGGLDAHTFSKAVRAVNPSGDAFAGDYDDLWVKFEFYFDDNWATQDQGKLGYSWASTDGPPSPGSNPTDQFEFLFHYFSPNHRKNSAVWPSVNPAGPFDVGDMVIGLDVYAADERIGTRYSEPIFFVEEAGVSNAQKLFVAGVHYVLWVHFELNTPSSSGPYDGSLEGWYSEDGGQSYVKGVDLDDFNWRGASDRLFGQNGLVRFNGGSGRGFEPGGAPNKNTGTMLPVQDYWYYVGEIRTQTENPHPQLFG